MRVRFPGVILPSAAVAAIFLLAACGSPQPGAGGAGETSAGPAEPAAPAAEKKAEMEGAEKAFFVMLPSTEQITVGIYENDAWTGKKLLFNPTVGKTDTNFFPIAQQAMWEIYGRQRGFFGPRDMGRSTRDKLGGIVTYKLSTGGKLCLYPLLDDKGKDLRGMYIWLE